MDIRVAEVRSFVRAQAERMRGFVGTRVLRKPWETIRLSATYKRAIYRNHGAEQYVYTSVGLLLL